MLYIVATPIGNMDEMSFRAVETLKNVSVIAAEDTRHSAVLLKRFDIRTPLVAYHKFNERTSAAELVERLKNGEDVALISDAGMPLVSDPGSALIGECIKNDVEFTVVSGPCAAVNAAVLSGFDLTEFCMLGFLPDKQKLRDEKILPYAFCPATLLFYSPPQSVLKDLEYLYGKLGARRVAVVREISKKFEQAVRGVLGEAMALTLKGEFVIVVEGYRASGETASVEELVSEYMAMGLSKMDAVKRAARDKGVPKSEVYKKWTNSEG